jgi:hypothetical protein
MPIPVVANNEHDHSNDYHEAQPDRPQRLGGLPCPAQQKDADRQHDGRREQPVKPGLGVRIQRTTT